MSRHTVRIAQTIYYTADVEAETMEDAEARVAELLDDDEDLEEHFSIVEVDNSDFRLE
jgi:hypothetical protein